LVKKKIYEFEKEKLVKKIYEFEKKFYEFEKKFFTYFSYIIKK
jgi:hypothetical protein